MMMDPKHNYLVAERGKRRFFCRAPSVNDRVDLNYNLSLHGVRYNSAIALLQSLKDGLNDVGRQEGADMGAYVGRVDAAIKAIVDADEGEAMAAGDKALEGVRDLMNIVEPAYLPLREMTARNRGFNDRYNLALAKIFLVGWEGLKAPYERSPIEGLTDATLTKAGVMPADLAAVAAKLVPLLYLADEEGNATDSSSSPDATPSSSPTDDTGPKSTPAQAGALH